MIDMVRDGDKPEMDDERTRSAQSLAVGGAHQPQPRRKGLAAGEPSGKGCRVSSESFRFGVEQRGIEFIPTTQRYGSPKRLFTIWFSINLSILCLTVGTLGVYAGLPFAWICVALTLGNVAGTFLMAAHSAQGPHIGIPQMIQSRAQFGVLGAGLPLLAVLAAMILYNSANAILIQGTIRMILPVTDTAAIVIFAAITIVVAFIGYELIHRLAAALAVLSGLFFISLTMLLIVHGGPGAGKPLHESHFSVAAFILVVTQATAWSLSSAPMVADYSRYLPENVRPSATFWYTGVGNFLSSTLMMVLGAWLAASFPSITSNVGLRISRLFGAGRYLAAFLIIVNLLQVNVMDLYSAYMSSTTIITSVRQMKRVSLTYKFFLMFFLMAAATIIAVAMQSNFNAYFSDLLAVLVYFLIPWSAINLADYYVVRKGVYSIQDMFRGDGIYGRYRWHTITIYLVSILAEIPFVSISFYVGPLARLIGADIAWLPGTLVPAALYCLVERAFLLPDERISSFETRD